MGTVSGVYLKYVALSTMGFAGAYSYSTEEYELTAAAAFFLYVGAVNGESTFVSHDTPTPWVFFD